MKDWRYILAVVYAVICIFDFILVPMWFGFTRSGLELDLFVGQLIQLDPSVQLKVIEALSFQHEPFTLKGAGLFHLAFGALLTGSAITGKKE